MTELDDLIEEQQRDDTHFVRPEQQNVSLETVGECIGASDTYFSGTEDEHYSYGHEQGGIHSFLRPQKGSVLVEGASWHGTVYGARNKKCKCARCVEAGKLYQRKLRERKKNSG